MTTFTVCNSSAEATRGTRLYSRDRSSDQSAYQWRPRWLFATVLAVGLICMYGTAQAATSTNAFRLVTPGTLTVATSATPPSFIIKPDGTTSGIVPTMLKGFAKKHDLKIVFQNYSFSGMLTAVESGRADVGGAIYYTKQRAKALLYVQPYGRDGSFLVIKKSNAYSSPASLKGKKVAVAAGYAQVPYVVKALGDKNVIQVPNDQIGVEAVKTGRAYGYVTGGEVSWYAHGDPSLKVIKFNKGDLGQPASITSTTDNMFVGCGHGELKKALDDYVNKLRQSGKLAKLLTKYHEQHSILNTEVQRPNLCKAQ